MDLSNAVRINCTRGHLSVMLSQIEGGGSYHIMNAGASVCTVVDVTSVLLRC
jgi:hypothetical protein